MFKERDKYISLFEKYKNFLTQTQRQTFQLYYFEDLSLREISEIVATTRNAVLDSLSKARQKLNNVAMKMESINETF